MNAFIHLRPGVTGPVCDFCSSEAKPQHTFVCQSFTVEASGTLFGIPITSSQGNWCACPVCTQLVHEEQWDELARRSCETFCDAHPEYRDKFDEVFEHMRAVHQEFREMYRNTQ